MRAEVGGEPSGAGGQARPGPEHRRGRTLSHTSVRGAQGSPPPGQVSPGPRFSVMPTNYDHKDVRVERQYIMIIEFRF